MCLSSLLAHPIWFFLRDYSECRICERKVGSLLVWGEMLKRLEPALQAEATFMLAAVQAQNCQLPSFLC